MAEAQQADVIYAAAGSPRGGIFHTNNGGQSWTLALTGTLPIAIITSPISPTRAYAATGGEKGVYETRDGQTWFLAMTDPITVVDVHALALPALDPERPYFGGAFKLQGFVVQRQPNQDHWVPNFLLDTSNVAALAIDPRNAATVYAGTFSAVPDKGGDVYRSDDDGQTWTARLGDYAVHGVGALAIDPGRTSTVYASSATGYGLFRSEDRGDTWVEFSNGLPVGKPSAFALAVDELGTPYAGTYDGVYRWNSALGQWAPFGLQGRTVWALAIEPGAPEVLSAGTDMGIWEINLLRWQVWLPVTDR